MAEWTRWERECIEQLVGEGAPAWKLFQAVPHSRYAIRRYVLRLERVPRPEPVRSPLRLWLEEREEISRGLAAGDSLRAIAARLGRATRRSRVRSPPTVAVMGIAPVRQTGRRWGGCAGRSGRSWPAVSGCARWSSPSSSWGGRRHRSRVGWRSLTRTTRRCACRTRRSISRCPCSPVARCARNSLTTCADDTPAGGRADTE